MYKLLSFTSSEARYVIRYVRDFSVLLKRVYLMFPAAYFKSTLIYEFHFSGYNCYDRVMTLEHGIWRYRNLCTWDMVTHTWLQNKIPFFCLR